MKIIKLNKVEPRAGIRRRRIPAMEMVGWGTERTRMPEVALGRFSSCSVSHFSLQDGAVQCSAVQCSAVQYRADMSIAGPIRALVGLLQFCLTNITFIHKLI